MRGGERPRPDRRRSCKGPRGRELPVGPHDLRPGPQAQEVQLLQVLRSTRRPQGDPRSSARVPHRRHARHRPPTLKPRRRAGRKHQSHFERRDLAALRQLLSTTWGESRGYEWDDDDLTPGQKKEGGLHQNLFDSDGNLKGSARFIPDDETDSDDLVITETVYVPIEQRRKSREQEELEEAIAAIVAHLIDRGIARAKPIVAQWYRETARPAFAAQRAKIVARSARRKAHKTGVIEAANVEPGQELIEAPAEDRPDMSRAEAQARYLAALAARAYSDEQMRLVASANIVDGGGDGITELEAVAGGTPASSSQRLARGHGDRPDHAQRGHTGGAGKHPRATRPLDRRERPTTSLKAARRTSGFGL